MSEIDTHPNKAEKPAGQTLSQRIAARIQRKPDASTTARNRSAFLSLRNEIQQAYTDGWSLLAIWKTLHDEGRVSFTYQAFRRYAHQLIDLPMSASGRTGGHGACVWSAPGCPTDARSWFARSLAQALAAGFQQSSRSADCAESPGSPVRLGSRQPALGLGHDLRADGPRLVVSGRGARSLFTRRRRLGDAPSHAASPNACCAGDGSGTPPTTGGGTAALRSWQPVLRLRLPGVAAAPSDCAQPFTSGELLGQRCDGELLPFAEGRAGVPDALRQLPGSENRPVRLHPLLQSPPSPLDVGLSQSDGV